MKNFILKICAAACLLLAACNSPEEMKWNTIDRSSYTIKIPSFMVESNDLNEEANLQFASAEEDVYAIVIEESAVDFESIFADSVLGYEPNLNGFANLIYDDFKSNADSMLVSLSPKTETNTEGITRFMFNASSKLENNEIYYVYGATKSDTSYYQVITWTMAKNKEKYGAVLQDMVNSLMPK